MTNPVLEPGRTFEHVRAAASFIRDKMGVDGKKRVAPIGLVLGSGLGDFAEQLAREPGSRVFPFTQIPHFPTSTVAGHGNRLLVTEISHVPVLILQGRIHLYEGYSASEVAFPVRVLTDLGVETLVLTNAAGAIGDHLDVPGFMLIRDHINLTGDNPLNGPNDLRFGPRFVDMSECYSLALRQKAQKAASSIGITLKEGIYCGLAGPSYETPAEIRMLKRIGSDAVGMSTVFETIAARHSGVSVLGISCLTNKAAGLSSAHLDHADVQAVAHQVSSRFASLLEQLVPALLNPVT